MTSSGPRGLGAVARLIDVFVTLLRRRAEAGVPFGRAQGRLSAPATCARDDTKNDDADKQWRLI